MRARGLIVGMTLVAVTLLQTGVAAADAPREGFVLEFGFGVNGLTDDDYVDEDGHGIDLDPLVGLHFAVLYRIFQYMSVGMMVHYGFIYPDGDNLDHEYSGFLGIIPEVRGHYAFGRFEPWLGFGVGYATAHTFADGEWRVNFGPWSWAVEAEGTVQLHGVGFALGTGVNIWLSDHWSLSPFFRMIFGAWPTACYYYEWGDEERDDCDDIDDVYLNEPDDLPHLWIVGAVAARAL